MDRFGAGGGASRRSLDFKPNRLELILWNEFVPVGKNGLAEGSFCPMTLQVVRFMAVAVEGNSFGAVGKFACRDLALAGRGFALPQVRGSGGSSSSPPVTPFNSTDDELIGSWKRFFEFAGPVRLLDDPKRSIAVSAGSSVTTWFELEGRSVRWDGSLFPRPGFGESEAALAKGAFSGPSRRLS